MNKPTIYGPYFQSNSKWQGDGSHLEAGYYFAIQDSTTGATHDVAGPFDDEAECELAIRRAEVDHYAGEGIKCNEGRVLRREVINAAA